MACWDRAADSPRVITIAGAGVVPEGSDGNANEISGIVRIVREDVVRDRKGATIAVKPVIAVVVEGVVDYSKGPAYVPEPEIAVVAEDAVAHSHTTGILAEEAISRTVFSHAVLERERVGSVAVDVGKVSAA